MRWELLWILVLIGMPCKAQYGARAMGMGGLDLYSRGIYATLGNPAGATFTPALSIMSGYASLHVPGLQTLYLSLLIPFKSLVYGISLQREGDDWLNEFKASFLAAHQLGNTSLGLRLNYHQLSVKDLDSRGGISIDAGGISKFNEYNFLSAYLTNTTLSRVFPKDLLPVYFRIGWINTSLEYLRIHFSLEKEVDLPLLLSAGLEYSPVEWISLRIGLSQEPLKFHGGLGLRWEKWALDFGIMKHPLLTMRHELTLIFTSEN